MGASAPTSNDSTTSLARLLDTEARLEALLSEARGRADGIVTEAEARVRSEREALLEELAREAEEARRRQEQACSERMAAISSAHSQALERLRAIDPGRIADLAQWIAGQVFDDALGTGPAG